MAPQTEYLGESDAKRLARLMLYQRVAELQPSIPKSRQHVLTLCGPQPAEIGCLRYLHELAPSQVTLVDTNPKGLEEAHTAWPGVNTHHGPIDEALDHTKRGVSFMNLDFMGYVNDDRLATVSKASKYMLPGGIVSYTFFRGREAPGKAHWNQVLETPTTREGSSLPALDEKRFVYNCKALQENLGPTYEPIFMLRYDARHEVKHSRHSPMGVLALQNVDSGGAQMRATQSMAGIKNGRLDKPDTWLRYKALALIHLGKTAREVEAMINVPVGTIAAWKAHETRGTYGNATSGSQQKED